MVKRIMLLALSAGFALSAVAPAEARQGCGAGFHRGPYDGCRPNGPGFAAGPAYRVGTFYPGRGYWDGRRYWWHRDRWHGGWRYR